MAYVMRAKFSISLTLRFDWLSLHGGETTSVKLMSTCEFVSLNKTFIQIADVVFI